MCGIAGIIGDNLQEHVLDNMLSVQKHRGPDFTGKTLLKNIFIGHNRLSIIDLSEKSNQPFISNCKRFIISFNGEIYNYLELKQQLKNDYHFYTNSDTEVLLAAYITWGKSCLEKLNGMFSFAIWDTKTAHLFAAKDRFGVKPFYYTIKNNTLYFSSEIKALIAAGIERKPNKKVWANYFCYGSYGMPDETFWENIKQLPGGHYLSYKKHELTISKWYFFENGLKKYQLYNTKEEVKNAYKNLLEDSIKLRFRADVPVGFNVSGGLDSSVLLAFVKRTQKDKNIQAFTFYTNNENYDELPWVENLISKTKYPLHKVLLQANEVEALAEKISEIQDEPYGGIPTIAYAKIFNTAKKNGVTVLLDGQGMDEQWAGYDYYTSKGKHVIQGVSKSPFKKNVLSHYLLQFAQKPIYPKPFESELLNMQYRDLFFTKIPRALRFNDRISMAESTELREPFLDYRLVEFAFAQPIEYKISNGTQKYLLREIVANYLDDTITYAPKRALQTPQREWLSKELKEFVSLQLKNMNNSTYSNWFDMDALLLEWNNYLTGDNESSMHIWQWVNFAMLF